MNPQDQRPDYSQGSREFQPGETIAPHEPAVPVPVPGQPYTGDVGLAQQTTAPTVQPLGQPAQVQPQPSPTVPLAPASPSEYNTPVQPPAATETNFFRPETGAPAITPSPELNSQNSQNSQTARAYTDAEAANLQMQQSGNGVSWTASEFISHHKSANWYLLLGGAGLVLAILMYAITRDIFNTAIVFIAIALFGVAASRQPRQLAYRVDSHGLTIGQKQYPYSDFRSFSILDEDHFHSITFMPLKRFMPPLSIYYDPADEHRIADVIASHLPFEDHKHDLTEKLMRRIRF